MKYYCVKQRDLADCGAACIATVLKQYGYQTSIERIRKMDFFGTRKVGEIISRFQDASSIRDAISNATLTIMIDVLMALGGGAILFFKNKILFAISCIMVVLYQEYVSSLKMKWLSTDKESLKEQTIATAENTIHNLESEKTTAESNVKSCKNTVETLSNSSLRMTAKTKEKQAILAQIEQLQNQLDELESQEMQIDAQLKPVTIKATSDGVVNTTVILTKGDAVSAGMVICTILPYNNDYKVQLYLHNEDVASIKENDLVRYNLAALPSSKYGNIIGHIVTVSKDSIVQEGEYTGYYLAEASIEKKEYYDKDGNKKELQPGMQLEARVILDEKTIMHYLIEKIGVR